MLMRANALLHLSIIHQIHLALQFLRASSLQFQIQMPIPESKCRSLPLAL